MRPKLPVAVVNGSSAVADGDLGKDVRTAQAWGLPELGFAEPLGKKHPVWFPMLSVWNAGYAIVEVFRFLPSKFSESSTTFRYAISVTTAPDARITDLPESPNSL